VKGHTKARLLSLVLAAGVIVASLGATGCGSSSSSSGGATTLKMGIEPWIGYGPWWIAKDQGYDKKHGFTLELTNFTTDSDLNAAFAAGKVDASNLALNNAWTLLAADRPMQLVLFEDISKTADAILAGPGINSVADLRGKSVAYEEGSTSDVLLRYALAQNDMTIDDVDAVHLPAAQAGSAAIAGRVDAAVTYEPYLTAAISKGSGFHLIYTADERPGLISDQLAVNKDFAEANPDLISNALRAWNDGVQFYRTHPAEAQAIIAKHVGESPADLAPTFKGVQLFDVSQSQQFLTQEFPKLAPEVTTLLKQEGGIEGNPDAAGAVNTSYGEKALGQ
jgi:NitT/TauT family transport system substrate-binding protein